MTDSTEIVVRAPYQPSTFEEVEKLGKAMAASGLFADSRDAAKAVVKVLAGQELGIPPVAAMRGLHVVEGKIELSGTLIGALIKRSAQYDYRVVTSTDEKCEIVFRQRSAGPLAATFEDVGTSTWTLDDAVRAGLCTIENGKVRSRSRDGKKKPWETYTRAMLFNRAMAEGARMHCPDVFDGPIYSEGEIVEAVEGDELEVPAELVPDDTSGGDDAAADPTLPSGPAVEPTTSPPDPTVEPGEVVEPEPENAESSAGEDGAPGEEPDPVITPAGDPLAEALEIAERLGWSAGKLLKFARDTVGKHIVRSITPGSLSDADATALLEALRAEVAGA